MKTDDLSDVEHTAKPVSMYFNSVIPENSALLADLGMDDDIELEPEPSFWHQHGLFIGLVALPLLLAVLYFGFIASGLYVSETKFIVRSAQSGGEVSLTSLLQTPGMSRAVDETYAVSTYVTSRDMVAKLEKERQLRAIMNRPDADFIYRFPNFYSRDNSEELYKAFQRFVDIDVDTTTGISTLRTKAFRAEDALALSKHVMEFADEFINRLNMRAHSDAIGYAETLIKETTARFADSEMRLAAYRNREMVLNPEKESIASMEALAKLSTLISKEEATLAQQIAQTPGSPTIQSQREKINSLKTEFLKLRQSVAGGENSIASKLEGFEKLMLERELSAKSLAAAVVELERSRQFAQTQRIYLQTIIVPNLADLPTRPWRILSIIFVLFCSLLVYWSIKSLRDLILEHQT